MKWKGAFVTRMLMSKENNLGQAAKIEKWEETEDNSGLDVYGCYVEVGSQIKFQNKK